MYNVPVASNERLRSAILNAGLTVGALGEAAGVDPKTCERWVTKGRTPHRVNARRAAMALHEDVSYLWPEIEQGRRQNAMHPDLVAIYASRADAPLGIWRALFEQAEREIGILVYAAVFVHELWPDFTALLQAKADSGCRVRVLLGDPSCKAVVRRGQDEKYGHGIASRCEQALMYYAPLIGFRGVEIHQHDTTLYNSIYRGDDHMVVNAHRFGINAHATPALQLRRAAQGGLFDGYAESFEDVWRQSWPAKTG